MTVDTMAQNELMILYIPKARYSCTKDLWETVNEEKSSR